MILIESEQLERLADAQHAIWAHWMNYMFSVCLEMSDGSMVISPEHVERWTRQANTDYADLSDDEKESDRKIVEKFMLDVLSNESGKDK